ncbi:MAG: endonuclease V [Candidatus Bathyarchaeia archaeon]
MSKKLVFEDKLSAKIRFVAGVDVAYTKELSIGAVAVLDYDSLRLVEAHTAKCKTRFPYVPTLLSFKEVPPAVLSIKKLNVNPDVFLVDGHGFAHPYGCGFASHLGLIIKKPTVGVTKNRLFGELENEAGKDVAFLRHDGKIVGARVVTKRGCKPVYVSVGHMVSLDTAIKIVRHCAIRSRIPEPILKAHEVSTAEKRKIK